MDHSGMDHSSMNHAGMDHGGMDHGNMCSMNMLFTWETKNLCVIFRSWQVTGTLSLIWTLLAIVLLTAGYELVRELARRYETTSQKEVDSLPILNHSHPDYNTNNAHDDDDESTLATAQESSSLLWQFPGRRDTAIISQKTKVIKAAFYAVQVFYSFFIMLLFMTYNGWIMLAVAVGAFVGYLVFGGNATSATKTAACH